VHNVGLVYSFSHAHDEVDETTDFPALWSKIQQHVLAVRVAGVHGDPHTVYPNLYPGQGSLERRMMEVIQRSGWSGPVGVSAGHGADVPTDLRNSVRGVSALHTALSELE
jgi:hypothetical protein